jgi:hypothetical protein
MSKGSIEWHSIVAKMQRFSAAQAVRVAQDAAKRAILDSLIETLREREELVIPEHLEAAIQEISRT